MYVCLYIERYIKKERGRYIYREVVGVCGRERERESKEKLAILIEDDPKAPFSIATTLRCLERRYAIPLIAPLYP